MYEENFKSRINILHQESGVSIKKFADMVGLSRQTMQFYLDGRRTPDSDSLAKICKALSVSADWLLCLSDVRTPSQDIKSAVAALGITEKAAQNIVDTHEGKKDALSRLLEESMFWNVIHDFYLYYNIVDSMTEESLDSVEYSKSGLPIKRNDHGSFDVSASEVASLLQSKMTSHIAFLCEGILLGKTQTLHPSMKEILQEEANHESK